MAPSEIVAVDGLIVIETRVGPATVTASVVDPLIEFDVAAIVVVPCPELVASPSLPTALLITATLAFEDVQVATEVRSWVVPSVYVPVAANCCVAPKTIVGFCGVIAIETSAAGFTTSVAEPVIAPDVMLIVVVPVPSVVARPAVSAVLLIVATVAAVELQ